MASSDRERLRALGDEQADRDPFSVLRNYAADHPAPPSVDYYARAERWRIAAMKCDNVDPLVSILEQVMAEIAKHALSTTSCPRVFRIRTPSGNVPGAVRTCVDGQLKGRGLIYDFATQRLSACKPNPEIDTRYTPPELTAENHIRALRAWQKKRCALYLPEMCERAINGDSQKLYELTDDRYDDVEIVDYANEILIDIPFANPQGRGERTFLRVHAESVPLFGRTNNGFGPDPQPAKLWACATVSICDNDPDL